MNRQKNISIDEKKLFIILQVIIYIFFLTKYLAFVSEQQIWYDDAHELLLKDIYFSDYKSFLRIADHHIGFSLLIKCADFQVSQTVRL